jgi:hypothetical protein
MLNEKHLWASPHHLGEHRSYYQSNPHLYIVRNPFLVLRSQYVFDVTWGEPNPKATENLSFRAYLLGRSTYEPNVEGKNRIEYWSQHLLNWASRSDVLIIDYDDLLDSITHTVEAISRHVGCCVRSSQRSITSTGIGRGLTDRFLKSGRQPVWEPDIAGLMMANIEHLAAVQPRMARHADRWPAAATSSAR